MIHFLAPKALLMDWLTQPGPHFPAPHQPWNSTAAGASYATTFG
jgi:hypothetical protein